MPTQKRIDIAKKYLTNVDQLAKACDAAGVPFYIGCTLMEKESGGRNVYGHDIGGALSGFPKPVNKSNFEVFEWLVFDMGWVSNGVGPAQITYKAYFPMMKEQGLKPWVVYDNMLFGLKLLKGHRRKGALNWKDAATRYNGAVSYGEDFHRRAQIWKKRLGI